MPDVIKKRLLKDKTAHSCEVSVIKDGEEYKLAEGKATIKTSEQSTILQTNKYKYPYIEKVYSVILCNIHHFNYEPTIDFLRDVERYDIRLTFVVDGTADRDVLIHDAEPIRIDAEGDWEFALTEAEGQKIAQINAKNTQKVYYG